MESSLDLLHKAQAGDARALELLYGRYRVILRDWARSRLPRGARSLRETEDLVQEAFMQALHHLDAFEPRHEGALLAYLRKAVMNRIRDEIRRVRRRPVKVALDAELHANADDPLREVVGREEMSRYEAALESLDADQRAAIVARVELGRSHAEVAALLGKPSADAARMFVTRALLKLAREMSRGEDRRA